MEMVSNESEHLVPIRVPNGSHLLLPKYFRFDPNDEELVSNFLLRKCCSLPLVVDVIAEVDIYKFNPWELPGVAIYGENEWYFFTRMERKYPMSICDRPNRAAGVGFWKVNGRDKKIGHPKVLGLKKYLTFFTGKDRNPGKTNWLMNEYRLNDYQNETHSMLDQWVLVRVYQKKGTDDQVLNHPREETTVISSPATTIISPDNFIDELLLGTLTQEDIDELLPLTLGQDIDKFLNAS